MQKAIRLLGTEIAMSSQDSTASDLGVWLRNLAQLFRQGWGSMSEDERRFVGNLDDFSAPCQIDAVWFGPPDTQYLVVTHVEDRPDLEVRVNGPFPTYEAVDRLEGLLGESRWDWSISKDAINASPFVVPQNAREAVESFFIGIIEDIRRLPFREPPVKPIIAARTFLFPRTFGWYIRGDVQRLSPSEVASEIVDSAKRQARFFRENPKQPAPAPEQRPWLKGHGGFVFPPIWIGEPPRPTFKEKLSGWPMFARKAFETIYKGKLLVVDEDGFIAIAERDLLRATDLLNEIMALRLLDGKPTFAFSEREVAELWINPETREIGGRNVPWASTRSHLVSERSWSSGFFMLGREIVPLQQFQKLVTRAESVAKDPTASDTVRFLLEAYTHFENSQYTEAFVLSWVIIEKHLYSVWKRYLASKKFPGKRRSADLVIEELGLAGELTMDDYRKLEQMKDLRNSIVHRGKRVSRNEAERALETGLAYIKLGVGTDQSPAS